MPSRLPPQWLSGNSRKCMSCHEGIVVITGRAHCFHDYMYIYICMHVYPKMALCGVETEKEKESLQNECNYRQKVSMLIHSWKRCKAVSSSNLRKEVKVDEFFLNLKNGLFKYKIFKNFSWNNSCNSIDWYNFWRSICIFPVQFFSEDWSVIQLWRNSLLIFLIFDYT